MRRGKLLRSLSFAAALALAFVSRTFAAQEAEPETVVLLHCLYRKPSSLWLLERKLAAEGYRVVNIGYPSRGATFAELIAHVRTQLDACCADVRELNFVTHSLGGLLVRGLAAGPHPPPIGRVVMLAPPNQGTGLADLCADLPLSRQIVGSLVSELGTGAESAPRQLGPATFSTGVIAGTRSLYPFVGFWLPGENDGVVALESTALEGMADRITVHQAHPFLINSPLVASEVIHFLRSGRFSESAERPMPNGIEQPHVGG